jgi:hypothetical protein
MENRLVKASTLAAVFMLLIGTMAIIPQVAAPYPGPYIFLSPSNFLYTTTTGPTGTRFNVSIYISNVTLSDPGLDGWQIELHYDDSIINVTQDADGIRAWPSSTRGANKFNSSYVFYAATSVASAMLQPSYSHVGPNEGAILLADAIIIGTAWKGDNGLICIIEFEITATPSKLQTLSSTLDITNAATWIKPTDLQNKATFIDGYYENAWEKPSPAYMGLDPLTKTFGPYPPAAVGQTFDEKVYIRNLSEAWDMTSGTFDLTYNATVIDVIGGAANVTFDALWGTASATFNVNPNPAVLDVISINISNPTKKPGPGDVLVCTIKFTVMMQQTVPPAPAGAFDKSDLKFSNIDLENHVGPIETTTPEQGEVKVFALISLPMALFKVVDPVDGDNLFIHGPAPAVGEEFDVDIVIGGPTADGLHWAWYLIAFQCRLFYDNSLLEFVSVTEGPFLKNGPWNLYGTFFIGMPEPDTLGTHILIGGILLPNPQTGEWDMTTWPNGTGVLATVRFKIIKQDTAPCNYTGAYRECELGLTGLDHRWALDKDGNWIPIDEASNVNGTYRIIETPSGNGRIIDVFGGAVNRGYGTALGTSYNGIGVIWPKPYGGQGVGGDMDLVIPQSVVYLFARVTYNCWPVQSKDVGYEIEGPFLQEGWNKTNPQTWIPKDTFHVRKYANRTDGDGIAWIKFQMPWPCDNPEDYFGKYRVTVAVDICGVVVTDVLWFDYYYLVEITKVTTDKYYYAHCENVIVRVEFRSKAQQRYPVLFAIVLQDELETHVSAAYYSMNVSGAKFCSWKTYAFNVTLHVEKWTFAGFAHIYVSAFDKDPTEGGAPWCPTYGLGWPPGSELPEIYILPK